jgi:hypothetical protein
LTLAELEKRVQIMEDIEAIKQLQVYYLNCLITTKWAELLECFAEDGVFEAHAGVAKGKKALAKIFKEEISINHIGQEGLFVVHPIVTVDGDKAKGSWLLYMQFAQPRKLHYKNKPDIDAPNWRQGFYDMEYVRENGSWKISRLKWRCRLISPIETSNPLFPMG